MSDFPVGGLAVKGGAPAVVAVVVTATVAVLCCSAAASVVPVAPAVPAGAVAVPVVDVALFVLLFNVVRVASFTLQLLSLW